MPVPDRSTPIHHEDGLSPHALAGAPLGRASEYPDHYAPLLLYTVPRAPQREVLGIAAGALPFTGMDLWTAYELTWLGLGGKPQIALATFEAPVDSPSIIESKSMKLYLGSFAQTAFAGMTDVAATIERDLSAASGARVAVMLRGPSAFGTQAIRELPGENIDDLDVACDTYDVDAACLASAGESLTRRTRSSCETVSASW
jgi:7-cyano-7-deazaguanine reductase